MQINDLKPNKKNKKKKRIGRGGKRGTYSGKGIKGQKARAGATTPSYEKEIISKFPKLKGLKNSSKSTPTVVINVRDLDNKFEAGKLTKEDFIEKRLVKKNQDFKILGDGELSKKFEIENIPVSSSAKKKIEEAGGSVKSKKEDK